MAEQARAASATGSATVRPAPASRSRRRHRRPSSAVAAGRRGGTSVARSSTTSPPLAHDEPAVAGERADVGQLDAVAGAPRPRARRGARVGRRRPSAPGPRRARSPTVRARVLERDAVSSTSAPMCSAISPTADDSPPAPQSVIAVYRSLGADEHVDQQLLDDRVADLHAGAGDLAGRGVHRGAGERRAADAVAAGAPAEHDDAVAGERAGGQRPIGGDADASGEHERVGGVGPGRRGSHRPRSAGRSCCRSRRRRRSRPRGCGAGAARRRAARRAAGRAARSTARRCTAIGRWAMPSTSRITPPTPVLAPPNGSTADGWLWVSALRAIVVAGDERRRSRRCRRTPTARTGRRSASVASRSMAEQIDWLARAVVGRDVGAERLVGAVLAPRLGQRLELDVGRVAARRASKWSRMTSSSSGSRASDRAGAETSEPGVVEVAHRHDLDGGCVIRAWVELGLGRAGRPPLDDRVGDEPPQQDVGRRRRQAGRCAARWLRRPRAGRAGWAAWTTASAPPSVTPGCSVISMPSVGTSHEPVCSSGSARNAPRR